MSRKARPTLKVRPTIRRGPKAMFIPDDIITSVSIDMMIGAKKELIIVTPWIGSGHHGFDRLLDCINRGVSVKLVCRPISENNSKHLDAVETLMKLGATVLFDPVLHAKMIITDSIALLVSSANLIFSSQGRNHEAGIVTEERQLIKPALEYLEELEMRLLSVRKQYCRGCGFEISVDESKPYCRDCYYSN